MINKELLSPYIFGRMEGKPEIETTNPVEVINKYSKGGRPLPIVEAVIALYKFAFLFFACFA